MVYYLRIHKTYNGFQVSIICLIFSGKAALGLLKVGEYPPATQQ
jgi:hypothetical protein